MLFIAEEGMQETAEARETFRTRQTGEGRKGEEVPADVDRVGMIFIVPIHESVTHCMLRRLI